MKESRSQGNSRRYYSIAAVFGVVGAVCLLAEVWVVGVICLLACILMVALVRPWEILGWIATEGLIKLIKVIF